MIKGIVAVGTNWAIGKKNGLLFKLKKDMQAFTQATTGNIVVMGYSTYLSLPKRPLKNRVNVVLWDKATSMDCLPDCITFNDFNQLVNFIKILSTEYTVFIIGGGMLYKSMLPYYDEVYVNKVDATDPEATVFFPDLDRNPNFKLDLECKEEEDNGYITKLCIYKRKENN